MPFFVSSGQGCHFLEAVCPVSDVGHIGRAEVQTNLLEIGLQLVIEPPQMFDINELSTESSMLG